MYIAAGATFLIEWDASTAKTFGVWCSAFTRLDPRSLPQGTPRTSDSWLLSIAPQTAALPIPFLIPLMPVYCYFAFLLIYTSLSRLRPSLYNFSLPAHFWNPLRSLDLNGFSVSFPYLYTPPRTLLAILISTALCILPEPQQQPLSSAPNAHWEPSTQLKVTAEARRSHCPRGSTPRSRTFTLPPPALLSTLSHATWVARTRHSL